MIIPHNKASTYVNFNSQSQISEWTRLSTQKGEKKRRKERKRIRESLEQLSTITKSIYGMEGELR